MKLYLNRFELDKLEVLMKLVKAYESDSGNSDLIFEGLMREVPDIDRDHLNNYWRSQSVDEFCAIHSIQQDDIVSTSIALESLETILKSKHLENYEHVEYLIIKYSGWFERKHGCSTGRFREAIYNDGVKNVEDVVSYLRIYGQILL